MRRNFGILCLFAATVTALAAPPLAPTPAAMPYPTLKAIEGGQASSPTAYNATWAWTAPTGVPTGVTIAGYNVFHASGSTVNCATATYAQANTALITTTSFLDPLVIPVSSEVCVYVEAVDSVGVASAPSATFLLNTTPPPAPGGPTPTLSPGL
jgi:hypothetical protein